MAKKITCNICKHNKDFNFAVEKNGYRILECPSCGIYFVHPQPSEDDLKKIYSFDKDYFKYDDFNKNNLPEFLEKRLKDLSDGDIYGKKFLDVGCGIGQAVFFAEQMGYDALGLEINDGSIEKMKKKGISVINSTLEDFNGEKGSFDAIYLGDIIEHVKNPSGFLDKCYFLLKGGGKLLIATPNANSFIAKYQFFIDKLFGIPWGHISPPHHLFEFSNTNLTNLLKSKKFKVEKVEFATSSFPYSVGNTGLFKKFKKEWRASGSFLKALKNNNFGNNILLVAVITLFYSGYLLDKFLDNFYGGGNAMTVLAAKK